MRVTGNYLVDLVSTASQKAEQQIADASQVATSGLRVAAPSDDPAAWALARRAEDRKTLSAGRGTAIASAQDRLQTTDGALASIADLVEQARTLAIQGSNGSLGATDRARLADQVQSLLDAGVAAGNTRTSDGEYVLAGARSSAAPFDAAGNYAGDAATRSIEAGEGLTQAIGVPGSTLTAASGVDVLPAFGALVTALRANNLAGIQASIDTLAKGTDQLARARVDAGVAMASLNGAEDARSKLELTLSATVQRAAEADPVAAAASFTNASNALATSQAVASKVFALIQLRAQ